MKTEVDEKAERWRRSLDGTQKDLAKAKQKARAFEYENGKPRELVEKLLASQ